MQTVTNIAHIVLRITGTIQIVLGLLFWAGFAYSLIPVHILSGLTLVISIWVLAVVALARGVNRGLALVAILWGLGVPVLGFAQSGLLPGPYHWIIEVLHLVVGLIAIGMGGRLAGSLKEEQSVPQPAS
jgi:hypothetical protein